MAVGAARLLLTLAFRNAYFLPVTATPSPLVLGISFALALLTGRLVRGRARLVRHPYRPCDALRGSGRSISSHSSFASKALLAVQACLSVVLVAGATMLARSLDKLENQDFGFR
ncbi:MAG: hypothetical protein WDO73_11330 [Ignavibacteriota bacterium]